MTITCPKCGTPLEERNTKIVIIGMSGDVEGYCKKCCRQLQFSLSTEEIERLRKELLRSDSL